MKPDKKVVFEIYKEVLGHLVAREGFCVSSIGVEEVIRFALKFSLIAEKEFAKLGEENENG